MISTILTAVARAGEQMPVTRTVIQRELAAIGVLRTGIEINKTTGRVETRYTVPVPDPTGGDKQHRMWDLDADKILFETGPRHRRCRSGPTGRTPRPHPADATPGRTVGPDTTTPDEDMRELTDTTVHRHGDTAPCAVCRQPCSLYVDEVCVHLAVLEDPPTRPPPARRMPPGDRPRSRAWVAGTDHHPFGGRPLHPSCDITPRARHRAAAQPHPAPAADRAAVADRRRSRSTAARTAAVAGARARRPHRKPLALLGCRDRPGRDLPARRHRRRRGEDQHDRRRRRRGGAVPDRSPHRARAAGADQRDGQALGPGARRGLHHPADGRRGTGQQRRDPAADAAVARRADRVSVQRPGMGGRRPPRALEPDPPREADLPGGARTVRVDLGPPHRQPPPRS